MMHLLIMAMAGFVTVTTPAPVQAPTPTQCGPYDKISKLLTDKYHEAIVARAATDQGPLLELWASHEGATWTLIGHHPAGLGCLLGQGIGYEAMPLPPKWAEPT
jgi:hypothetical protein